MTADRNTATASVLEAPKPFVVHYSRKALLFLFAFGTSLAALGLYLLTDQDLTGIALVPAGIIVMAHTMRYFISTRLVTILPTGLAYHGLVKTFRAEWSEISKVGAGQGDDAGDSITFHAAGPFGIFGKFAINEMLMAKPNGDLATISDALERARRGSRPAPQFGKRRPLSL